MIKTCFTTIIIFVPSVHVKKDIYMITQRMYLPIKVNITWHMAGNLLSHKILFTLIDTYTFHDII